jgi:protein TonB
VTVPSNIPTEEFEAGASGVPGGVEGGIPGGIVGGLSGSAEPPPTADPVRLDSRREEARPIARVDPVYPDLAAQARVQGVVILEVMVSSEGFPAAVKVLRGVPLLDSAAVAAVREWRWKPYFMLDRAVPFWVTVTVSFRLT